MFSSKPIPLLQHERSYEKTLDMSHVLGSRVISKSGVVVGNVKEVRIHPHHLKIEGVVVRRGPYNSIYLGRNYIDRVSDKAVILSIDPVLLLVGKPVLTSQGKKIGTVKRVIRKHHTNELESINVSSFWKKEVIIPSRYIKIIHHALLLSPHYHNAQRHIRKKP